ncbi:MAG: hypothetical protein RL139_667 [Gemmatimonadota bacterium]|jgi:integrase/recombinase XerC
MNRPSPRSVGDIRIRAARGPDTSGRWYWRAMRLDETVWVGWATEADAVRAVASLVARDAVGEERGEDVRTVRDLLELWMGYQSERADLSPHTVAGRRIACRQVVRVLGAVLADRLDRATMERLRDTRIREGAASSTVHQELSAVCSAWRWARESGLVPARDLPRPRLRVEPRRASVTPSRGDVVEVLQELTGWARVAAYLYASTGCRLGELAAVRLDQLDLEAGTLTVRGKTGAREVPLAPPVVRELEAWLLERAPGARLFGVSAQTMRTNLRRLIHAAVERINARRAERRLPLVTPWSPQGFRRAVVDALYRSGVDIGVAASIAGHSPSTALRAYRRVTTDERASAARMARLGYLVDGDVVELAKHRG